MFFGGYPPEVDARVVFALTSIVVAVREEVLYRGVLLNALDRRLPRAAALALSTAVFVLYHWGAQPLWPTGFVEIGTWGLVLGAIYLRTGSLMGCIAIHAAYDALWSLSPLSTGWPDSLRVPFLITGSVLVLAWFLRPERDRPLRAP